MIRVGLLAGGHAWHDIPSTKRIVVVERDWRMDKQIDDGEMARTECLRTTKVQTRG